MMGNKVVFENYQDKCPHCGGELDSNQRVCQFCGQNLEEFNVKHRDNEATILEAIEDIDEARRSLRQREKLLTQTKKKGIKSKALKFVLIAIAIYIAFGMIAVIGVSINDSIVENKVEELKNEMRAQSVETVQLDAVDIDGIEFVETKHQSIVGHIQESEDVLKIPFYDDGTYGHESIFKGSIYVSKDGLEEVGRFDEYYTRLEYEGFSLTIKCENAAYYDDTTDCLTIIEDYIDKTERLKNIQIGNIVFECYKVSDTYHLIANPYHNCFINCEVYDYKYDDAEMSVEEMFKIIRVDTDLEIG